MKLAVCYSVFNGLELLKKSIEQICDQVDIIIICYQIKSNTGNENPELIPYLKNFYFIGQHKFILVEFTPDPRENTKGNERNKHNLMIDSARNFGASHFLLSACDHFYDKIEFVNAKKECELNNYDVTITKMFTYYKHPTYQLTPIETYFMPFICKLYEDTRIDRVKNFPVRVDPSVQINTFRNWKLFNESEIMMHHYSMIRNDIRNKFNNAAASIRWTQEMIDLFIYEYENHSIAINAGISYFQNRTIKVVDNFFNI